jgi:hypothetical protein
MEFILVPHRVTDTTATIWVGVVYENDGERRKAVSLELDEGARARTVELDDSGWKTWKSYNPGDEARYPWQDRLLDWALSVFKRTAVVETLEYRRVLLGDLEPGTSYSLRLRVDGRAPEGSEKHLREARVTTLPATLPGQGEKPFTALLGSCFYKPNDEEGMVGKTFRHLPENRRPDIKVLCGDQVYLDNPWYETTLRYNGGNLRRGLFRATLFRKYMDNWKQVVRGEAGFRQLLRDGANYFCSDDHEFWNNAPNFGGIGFINTLSKAQRCWWLGAARELFEAIQSPKPLTCFDVAMPSEASPRCLSFCIADTRINRSIGRERFMDDDDLKAVGRWIRELRGPGVLVVGQPLLTGETDAKQSLREDPNRTLWSALDRNLADYDQYRELVDYVKASAHSIVVLSGDVHFGRVACVRREAGSKEADFVEIIASPMQLVTVKNKLLQWAIRSFGKYKAPPTHEFAITESRPIAPQQNHFVTVEFSSAGGGTVDMRVWSWPVPESEEELLPNQNPVFEATLS